MFRRLKFRHKLFIYLTVIFAIFAVLILAFQYEREKDFRVSQLEGILNNVTELTNNYIESNNLDEKSDFRILDSLSAIIPDKNIRITVISPTGVVLYDSEVSDYSKMENHLHRPEIQESAILEFGANIRESSTTGNDYYYYSKFFTDYFVRTAALYDIEIIDFLKVEKLFIIYIFGLFVIILILLLFLTRNTGRTLTRLKDFTVRLSGGDELDESIDFPNDEVGVISKQIIDIYKKLKTAKDEITIERNKHFSHLHALNEGIAFFSPEKTKILTNNKFIQYLNLISDKSTISAEKIFEIKDLKPIFKFIDKQLKRKDSIDPDDAPIIEHNLTKNNRYFTVQCVFFQDRSFEIMIKDTTKLEKQKMIKQQMTSNIAHELKTPVTTVMGYLETMHRNHLPEEKQKYFIERAYAQAKRLSLLIEDISMLNKIEETGEHFVFEHTNIHTIIMDVHENMKPKLDDAKIKIDLSLSEGLEVNGNQSLLNSVFYNLFDNVVKYGGEGIKIKINNYLEDNDYYYFSFSNTGNSIDDIHLSRIFERFYRVDTGRSRKTGGTGLGLAIVKNAIQLHGGDISARKYKDGGVEFLFTLEK